MRSRFRRASRGQAVLMLWAAAQPADSGPLRSRMPYGRLRERNWHAMGQTRPYYFQAHTLFRSRHRQILGVSDTLSGNSLRKSVLEGAAMREHAVFGALKSPHAHAWPLRQFWRFLLY